MTQREYIAGTFKIGGFILLIYGIINLYSHAVNAGYAYAQSKKPSITYADIVPDAMKREYDLKNKADSQSNRFMCVMQISLIPRAILLILFGLILIKKEHWFTAFLLGKDTARKQD